MNTTLIIPALNEAQAIAPVLRAIPANVTQIIVVDNGSTDDTAAVARSCGATVVHEPVRGYGRACLTGIAQAMKSCPDVIAFMDADGSDDPAELHRIIEPIQSGRADFVIGSRVLGSAEAGALSLPQRYGNALACGLMRWVYGARHTDLGPFRAISTRALHRLAMDDENFGWTIQMQIRARRCGIATIEVPVNYRRRTAGQSKISRTVRGVIGAGSIILSTIFNELRPEVQRRYACVGSRGRLCIMARYPTPGACKTRLISSLGAEGAAAVHRQLTEQTLAAARRLTRHLPIDIELWFTGATQEAFMRWLERDLIYGAQTDGDLGERLRHALAARPGPSVFIGTDCPGLTAEHLRRAFISLHDHDLVIGPATDGGYYLIGGGIPDTPIDWGTDLVRQQTLDWAKANRKTVRELEELADVDHPEDLAAWKALGSRPVTMPPAL